MAAVLFEFLAWIFVEILLVVGAVVFRSFFYTGRPRLHGIRCLVPGYQYLVEWRDGTLFVDRGSQLVRLRKKPTLDVSFRFDEIEGLYFRTETESANSLELVQGFDLFDIFQTYRDQWYWHNAVLRTTDTVEWELFRIREYERREFLMNWWYPLEKKGLAKSGLYRSSADEVWDNLQAIRDTLLEAGWTPPFSNRGREEKTA